MPSSENEALVEDLLQSTGLLVRRLRAETNPGGLTWSQAAAIGKLSRYGPATTATLARAEGVKPQSMGVTLVALERDGLVTRTPDPDDGRQWLYALTPAGHAARAQRQLLKRSWMSAALAELQPEETQALARAVTVLRRMASR